MLTKPSTEDDPLNGNVTLAGNTDVLSSLHHRRPQLLTLALLSAISLAHAAEAPPASFQHKDWDLQCDNTLTCRATGYQEEGEGLPVSMLVPRAAGPNTPVKVQVIALTEESSPSTMELSVGCKVIRGLEGDPASVPTHEVPELLGQLLNAATATVRSGNQTWTLSLAGAKAVLLKMDEAQGRVGTPGAIVHRGNRPESSVLPLLPAPVIKAVKPLPSRPGDVALGRRIYSAFPASEQEVIRDQCNSGFVPAEEGVEVFRLDDKTLLISVPFNMGAYNYSSLLWIANDRAPYKPRAVEANGEFDAETGIVHSSMRARGIGDCAETTDWQYDGQGFTLAAHGSRGMCRGFPGGAWSPPDYVTTTKPVK